jgi:hypothetical protein
MQSLNYIAANKVPSDLFGVNTVFNFNFKTDKYCCFEPKPENVKKSTKRIMIILGSNI